MGSAVSKGRVRGLQRQAGVGASAQETLWPLIGKGFFCPQDSRSFPKVRMSCKASG